MDFWFKEKHTKNVELAIRVDRQLYSGQSEFQRIDIFDSVEFGRFLTLDGYMMLTEKDEFIYHEMIVHVPMAVMPRENIILEGFTFISRQAARARGNTTPKTTTAEGMNWARMQVRIT